MPLPLKIISKFLLINAVLVVSTNAQWPPTASENIDCCDDYCYSTDENPNLFFGTKTAYEFIHGRNSRQHLVPQCTPVQFWSVNQYGTKLPTDDLIIDFFQKLPKLKQEIIKNYDIQKTYPQNGRLCNQDLENLKQWKWDENITWDNGDLLTNQGKDDMKYLAKRYQTRYINLLGIPYNEQDYVFKYADHERMEQSYKSFIEGLFGSDAYKVQSTAMNFLDLAIDSYQMCVYFEEEKLRRMNKNGETSEASKFIELPMFQKMIRDVSTKLGYKYKILGEKSVKTIYEICRLEKAWKVGAPSPWCAAFTKEQLKLFEYMEDLKSYYLSGYGNEESEKIGCAGVKEMLSYFEKVANGERNQPKSIVYFTDQLTVRMLLVALGFAKDPYSIRADNYNSSKQRQWQTSRITPFAANLVAVFYDCPTNNEKNIMFFLNENPIDFPGCKAGLCSWQSVHERLKPVADKCTPNLYYCSKAASIFHANSRILSILFLAVLKIVL